MLLRRAVVLTLTVLVAGCGGSSTPRAAAPASVAPSPSPVTSAADMAAVTTTWVAFFSPEGTVDSHIALLQDGALFRAELAAAAKSPQTKDLAARVSKVEVTGTTAAVTYDLLGAGGATLLAGAGGEAVQVGGRWLVSKKTYCQLVSLQNPSGSHPGCDG